MSIWDKNIKENKSSLYQTIARNIQNGIQKGDLKPGDQLPPHRELADKIGVTVGTVARGYSLAASWGLISGEIGRGTIVSSPERNNPHLPLNISSSYCDLGILKPTATSDSVLRKIAYEDTLKKIGTQWKNRAFTVFPPEFGLAQYREAGASWISRLGIEADENDVLVTGGAQEAFHLLLSTLTTPGEAVLVEELTHISLKALGNILGLKMIGIKMDDQGIIPNALQAVVRQSKARVLFVTPTYNSPTTAIMDQNRREQIIDIALKNDLFIIENGIFSDFVIDPPHPIVTICPKQSAYVASFSFCASPEIRVGFLKASRKHIPKLRLAKRAFAISGSMISAEIASHWIKSGILKDLMDWQTAEIRDRTKIAAKILHGLDFCYAPNGIFLWLTLPEPWRSTDFARAARERNTIVMESERFIIGRERAAHAVRISLTSAQTKESFIEGLKTIADLLGR